MAMEIELKLSFPPEALPDILRHQLIAGAPRVSEPETLDNTYFDTPALALQSHRVGLRLRQQAGGPVLTVKCAGNSFNGLSRRQEWETPWHGQFDFSAVTDDRIRALLTRVRDELVPVFTTRFSRDTRLILRPDTRILVMIDTGHIVAGEKTVPIHEVELELAEGDENGLALLAEELQKTLPLTFENVSKAQRGYKIVTL